jgi:homoserine kinase type II
LAQNRPLEWDEIRSILSLYHLDGLEAFGGIASDGETNSYWVRAEGRRYVLRISARRRFADMVFEKDLMGHLFRSGVPVPRVIENVASGAFTPWEVRGRYVTLFEHLEGRGVGVFEIRHRHVCEIGEFIGKMHVASERFRGHRRNELELEELSKKAERLTAALERRRVARRLAPDIHLLLDELALQHERRVRGPRGIVHGNLITDCARFKEERLIGITDFDLACRERLTWDLATAINAWCWEPETRQVGGPAGTFDRTKVRGVIEAYDSIRPLSPLEREELGGDLRLTATSHAIHRIVEFELKKPGLDGRRFRDYRHFTARLAALRRGDSATELVA